MQYVSTTADIWSAKKRNFFGVTCHWVTKDLKWQSAALACKRFKGVHSYERVAEMLEDAHGEFNLKIEKITATVTDNGSNVVKAFGLEEKETHEVSVDTDADEDDAEETDVHFAKQSVMTTMRKKIQLTR